MGMFDAIGVPGVDGAGEAIAIELLMEVFEVCCGRLIGSGAGLLDAMRLAGRSILMTFP